MNATTRTMLTRPLQILAALLFGLAVARVSHAADAPPAGPDRLLAASSLSVRSADDRSAWHTWVLAIRDVPKAAPAAAAKPDTQTSSASPNDPAAGPVRVGGVRAEAVLAHFAPDLPMAPRATALLRPLVGIGLPDGEAFLAAHEETAFVIVPDAIREKVANFPPPPPGPTRVYAFAVVLREGRWYAALADRGSRVEALAGATELPSLPGERPVLAVSAMSAGLMAVLGPPRDKPAMDSQLWLLPWRGVAPTWEVLEAPREIAKADAFASLALAAGAPHQHDTFLETPLALLITGIDGQASTLLHGAWREEQLPGPRKPWRMGGASSGGAGGLPMRTSLTWHAWNGPLTAGRGLADARIAFATDGLTLATRASAETWRLWTIGAIAGSESGSTATPAWRELGEVPGIRAASNGPVLAPLDGEAKLALFWPSTTPTDRDRLGTFLSIDHALVSTATGRVLERGLVGVADSGTASQYRFVAIMLSWVVGLVVIVLVRPKEVDIFLPGDVSLAEPLRRMVAGLMDLTVAAIIASVLVGNSFDEVMMMGVAELFITDQGQSLLLATILIGVLSSTIGESISGRTLGKAFAGCMVVRCVAPGADAAHALKASPPSFAQALLRNIIKWCLPPAAMVALWREGARHRGDQYTNTAVVVEIPPDDIDEEE